MPGISDREALKSAIIDSLIVTEGTPHRLRSRNVRDLEPALRLRKTEASILRERCKDIYVEMENNCWYAMEQRHAGNHYVYQFMFFITKIVNDKELLKSTRDKTVVNAFNLVPKLMIAKMPLGQNIDAVQSIAEGFTKSSAKYITLRTIHTRLMSMYSKAGAYRGKFQSISTHSQSDALFNKKIDEFLEEYDKDYKKDSRPSPGVVHNKIGDKIKITMVRISDLIYIKFYYDETDFTMLLTPNHFERITFFLCQFSNFDLGLTLGYGMDCEELGAEVASAGQVLVREMCRIGLKDDLAPGEAGKAVTDMYKAKLSQTDELPWDNFKMLRQTYSQVRRDNADTLYEYFSEMSFDPDVKFNLSYFWKIALQPDSSIRDDFVDLTVGLSKPNKISETAEIMLELAYRRNLLIGCLKENRQPNVVPDPGYDVDPELARIVASTHATDSDLGKISFAMMKNIKVTVENVFPTFNDVSHLTMKDKSSSVSDIRIRDQIKYRSEVQKEILDAEHKMIKQVSKERTSEFFKNFHPATEREPIIKAIQTTANDIISSLDEKVGVIFLEADRKYNAIIESMSSFAHKYGSEDFIGELLDWSLANPDLLINTATEPKLGEVHKRTVRIFYMFEKGMKTFLSQFERMARIMDYYIKGAEIVKGDRAREKHMNILSSAHRASGDGILAYQILFDLSKFSQKFNHRLIDAAAKVIGEACDYEAYKHISCLFKAAFLYVSARNVDEHYVGVLGAFEGFLNFLWTGIHATVMDIALRDCGRSGDLAAYSDDGLLMFTMDAGLNSPHELIHSELNEVIGSITRTYSDYGLDFNLGKTLISRTLAEFLGIIQYKGKRLPTWVKELCSLGKEESVAIVKSLSQGVTDISSQMSAMLKAGMNPYAATYLGYLEVLLGPGRRVVNSARSFANTNEVKGIPDLANVITALFFCLNGSFGGCRIPDTLTSICTADFDPISEMIRDIEQLALVYPDVTKIYNFIWESISPTNNYTKLFLGSMPVNTEGVEYSSSFIRKGILSKLKNVFNENQDHPLSRHRCPYLHYVLESMNDLYLPLIVSMSRYIIDVVEYNKLMAPTRSSAMAKLLRGKQVSSIQSSDTRAFKSSINRIGKALLTYEKRSPLHADDIYDKSFPKLSFAPSIPSYRDLASREYVKPEYYYNFRVNPLPRLDNKGTYRLMNREYYDELVPPLVTSDVNLKHLNDAPDIQAHCLRSLYSEIVSAASQGHDILLFAQAICNLNDSPMLPDNMMGKLHDMRKVAIANRKKSLHRVHWSMATRSATTPIREGNLNRLMTQNSHMHYSLIVTVSLAHAHLAVSCTDPRKLPDSIIIKVNPDAAMQTILKPMTMNIDATPAEIRLFMKQSAIPNIRQSGGSLRSIQLEAERTIDQAMLDIQDNFIVGRMGMFADLRAITDHNVIADPLRYAMVWSLVKKLNSISSESANSSGVSAMRMESFNVEAIPPDLASIAIIYRAYTQIRKAEINDYMKSDSEDPILPEEIARGTLKAAQLLQIVHNVSLAHLMSRKAAETYNAVLIAIEQNMVYYTMDVSSESISSNIISHQRARAVGRVIESIISQLFASKIFTPEYDRKRLGLQIIKDLVRGSVHRKDPYNARVAAKWFVAFGLRIRDFVKGLPKVYKVVNTKGRTIRCPGLNDDLLVQLEKVMFTRLDSDPEQGNPGQFDAARKYVINLGKWGYLPVINFPTTYKSATSAVSDIDRDLIAPAAKFVRSVSYGTVSEILRKSNLRDLPLPTGPDHLSESIHTVISKLPKGYMMGHALVLQGSEVYRDDFGELREFDFRLCAPDYPNYLIVPLMSYALSLPLLLTAGISSLTSVTDHKLPIMSQSNSTIMQFIKSFSLPFTRDDSGIELHIFRGMSECELIRSFQEFKPMMEVMVVVEVPPSATLTSLGLIAWLTTGEYSYTTPGLSSDMLGFSLYIIAYIDPRFPNFHQPEIVSNDYRFNLGYLCMKNLVDYMLNTNHEILSSLVLTPMHQAGLPIGGEILYNGEIIQTSVVEELIDRSVVSFVEASRPNNILRSLVHVNDFQVAHLARALRWKSSDDSPPYAAIISSSFYYYTVLPIMSVNDYANLFIVALNSEESENAKRDMIYRIFDPMLCTEKLMISSLKTQVQLLEPTLPDTETIDMEYDDSLESTIRPLLDVWGSSMIPEEERGKLLSYFRSLRDPNEITLEDLKSIILPPQVKKKVVRGGRSSAPKARSNQTNYGITAIPEKPIPLVDKSSRTQHIMEDTRITFSTAFRTHIDSDLGDAPRIGMGTSEDVYDLLMEKSAEWAIPSSEMIFLSNLTPLELQELRDLDGDDFVDKCIDYMRELRRVNREKGGVK